MSRRKSGYAPGGRYRTYRRPPVFGGIKQREKKPKLKISLLPVIYLILLLAFTYFLFFSDYFKIKDVMVEGNQLVAKENILKEVPSNSNIFRLSVSKIIDNILENNTEIKNAQVYRGIPNALKIVVLEYDNKLIWESGGQKYLMSAQGRVTKSIGDEQYNYPRVIDSKNIAVRPGDEIVSPSFVSFVLNINSHCFETTNLTPLYYQVPETTFDLYMYTDAGYYIKLNTLRSSAKQLDNLKKVLVSKKPEIKEYVDLRVDGLAYYK